MTSSRTSASSHVALAMSVRPARLGLLLPTNVGETSWMCIFEAALAAHSRFWGASGNLIFPLTADLAEREVFWEIADRFDADAFVSYAPTRTEMREFAPSVYESVMGSLRQQVSKLDVDTAAADDFLQRATRDIAFDVRPTAEQLKLINARLAPFHRDDSPDGLDSFNAMDAAAWPFTDALGFVERPGAVRSPTAPGGAARQLLLTASVGRIPSPLVEVLREDGVNVTEEPLAHAHEWARVVLDRRRGDRPTYPWAIGDEGLAQYHSRPWSRSPAAVVAGDSPWDFALFYALKRMTGMAWWLPSWLKRDRTYLLELSAALEFEPRREGRELIVVSASSETVRDKTVAAIRQMASHRLSARAADWQEALPEEPLRLYEKDNEGRTELVQLLEEQSVDLRTPLPVRVGTREPTDMRWLTEIRGHDWTPLRHRALGTAVLGGMFTTSDLVRTTRDGVGYFAPGGSLITGGASLESQVARPTLRPLPLVEQIRIVLAPHGWSCELSDKGIYANESMRLFGGFEELCDALRDSAIRGVIDAYRAREQNAPGPRLSSDGRRYLLWRHFENLLGRERVGEIIDRLLARRVLRRGVALKCRRCRQAAWYGLDDLNETFTCGRCHLDQAPDRGSWFGTNEPVWSYRLAEVLYQFLENDGQLTVLAVHDEFKASPRPFAHGFELELTPTSGRGFEVDIFSSDGYRFWIGEAKTDGRFEPGRLAFIAQFASTIGAYGVLLATSRQRWPPATVTEAQAVFAGSWPRLRMVAGVATTA